MQAYNFHESYLRAIFGFVGVTDVEFISAQPMDITPDLREAAIAAAMGEPPPLPARSPGQSRPARPWRSRCCLTDGPLPGPPLLMTPGRASVRLSGERVVEAAL